LWALLEKNFLLISFKPRWKGARAAIKKFRYGWKIFQKI